jgi:hypothetical protein
LENWIRTLDRFGKQGLALLASLLITLLRSGWDRFDKALIMAKFFKQAVFGHKQTLNARKVVIGRLLQFVSWMRYAAGHRRNDKRGYLLATAPWLKPRQRRCAPVAFSAFFAVSSIPLVSGGCKKCRTLRK